MAWSFAGEGRLCSQAWVNFAGNLPKIPGAWTFVLRMIERKSLVLLGAAGIAVATTATAADQSGTSILSELVVREYALKEEKPEGFNKEPEWVQNRRFSNTRVYIQQDPWEVGFEQWFRVRTYDHGRVTQRSQTEIEIGLPYRMQLDVYQNMLCDNTGGGWQQEEEAFELRYAFADWGVIPGNPTLYLEYTLSNHGSDLIEPKILLGDNFGNGWHWGLNIINEHELWGERTTEWRVSGGISRTLVDSVLSVGIEGQWAHANDSKSEGLIGPSIQWRPTANTHLDLVALAGLTNSSPNAECWLIFGFDFGKGARNPQGYKPTTVGGS